MNWYFAAYRDCECTDTAQSPDFAATCPCHGTALIIGTSTNGHSNSGQLDRPPLSAYLGHVCGEQQ